MRFTNFVKLRPILITGKTGTGKTTKALSLVNNPTIFYADEIDYDIQSIPIDNGIIIEDIHINPNKEAILTILRLYRGQIVITSINEKSVPKEIKSMCQIKRAGSTNYISENLKKIAPRSESPFSHERDTYSLVMEYLKSQDRDKIRKLLHFNKPADTQIITWLIENIHPNRLLFVDGVVRRRWSQEYFYDILAYTHMGNFGGRINMPLRKEYSKLPYLSAKLGVKNPKILQQLLKDEEFRNWAKTKLNNSECRMLKLGEKKRKRKLEPINKQKTLLNYGGK